MPTLPHPAPGSRWFCKLGRTGVVEIAHDERFTRSVRYYLINNPQRRENQRLQTLPLEDFHESYQPQPRYSVGWINEGSVWRRLDEQNPIATNCCVVAGINESGYIRRRPITTEGLGEPNGAGDGVWMGGLTVFNFMRNYARVWGDVHGVGPDLPDDPNECYPLVLYRNQLMTPELPGESLDEEIQGALGRPRKPKKKRKRRRKKAAKPEPIRRSALDRLLDDDF